MSGEIDDIMRFWDNKRDAEEEVFRWAMFRNSAKRLEEALYHERVSSDEEDPTAPIRKSRKRRRRAAAKAKVGNTANIGIKRRGKEREGLEDDENRAVSSDDDDNEPPPIPASRKKRRLDDTKSASRKTASAATTRKGKEPEWLVSDDDDEDEASTTSSEDEDPAVFSDEDGDAQPPNPKSRRTGGTKSQLQPRKKDTTATATKGKGVQRPMTEDDKDNADETAMAPRRIPKPRKRPVPQPIEQSTIDKGKKRATEPFNDIYQVPAPSSEDDEDIITADMEGFGAQNPSPPPPLASALSTKRDFQKQSEWLATLCLNPVYQSLVAYRTSLTVCTGPRTYLCKNSPLEFTLVSPRTTNRKSNNSGWHRLRSVGMALSKPSKVVPHC